MARPPIVRRRSFNVYCDGASRKDGRGGWGYTVLEGQVELRYACGGDHGTTNNRMELKAAIMALRSFPAGSVIAMHSDSQYVINGITDHIDLWLRTNWRNSQNKPVKNPDLWMELGELDADRKVSWHWVRGHNGNFGNERADELAGQGVPDEESPSHRGLRRT